MLLARLEVILGRTRLVGWEVPMVEECEQLEVSVAGEQPQDTGLQFLKLKFLTFCSKGV